MADWKKGTLGALASLAALAGLALLVLGAVQAWRDGLDARIHATFAVLIAAAVLGLSWKRVQPASRALLAATLVLATVGVLAVLHGPRADDAWRLGPLSLAALVNLTILLSGGLSLVVLLRGTAKLRPWLRVALGLIGALLLAPFAFGAWYGLSLAELMSGPGPLAPLPIWCQPAVLGAAVLLPISLVFLAVAAGRAARSEERSTLRGLLLVLCAVVPIAVVAHGLLVRPGDGLAMRLFADHGWTSLEEQRTTPGVELSWSSPPAGVDGDFWVEWEGGLHLPDDRPRRLRLTGEGCAGHLYVDGLRLLDDLGETGSLELDAGHHRLRVAAVASAGTGRFALEESVDDGPWQPLAPALLSHDRADREWQRTPRQAAQVGLEWLQSSALEWQREHRCFGCHVQAQALMGMRVARDNRYEVNEQVFEELAALVRETQDGDGGWHDQSRLAATQYAAMALAHAGPPEGEDEDAALHRAVTWLADRQADDGELPIDATEPPIDQGSLMTTANGVFALRSVSGPLDERDWHRAAGKGVDWIRGEEPETTQDRVMQLLALSREGDDRAAARRTGELLGIQRTDGSWRETERLEEGNAYATGQVLYGLKQAGEQVRSGPFRGGVRFLMERQRITGEWVSENTGSRRPSDFAPTMWAVIGLAGSFGELIPEIVEPVEGAPVDGPTPLVAEVSNYTGEELRDVRFSVDGAELGPAGLDPATGLWRRSWDASGVEAGLHEVVVIATTVSDLEAEDRVQVHAGPGLRVALEEPGDGQRLAPDQRVAARPEGLAGQVVERVEFRVDAVPLGEALEAGDDGLWSVGWDTRSLAPGRYRVEAVATGSAGQEARDEVVAVKEAPIVVRIDEPIDGASVVGAQPCAAEVRVDPGLLVDRLRWNLDGQPFAEALLPPANGQPIRTTIACDFEGVLPGEYPLEAVADDGQGHRGADEVRVRVGEAPGPGYLRVQLEDPDRPGSQLLFFAPDQVELVLDMSGSMWGRVAGGTKADVAREVLGGLVETLPDGPELGLRVYGHRREKDCDDIELLVSHGPVEPAALRSAMAALQPVGMTPIDRALRQAAEDLGQRPGSRAIVLVSDGVESCKGDPVAAAAAAGEVARVHVVGFDVGGDPEALEQLRGVAEAGGGTFSAAGDADQLQRALEEAVSLSWSVWDEAGTRVMTRPLSLESHQLMSGVYRLQLDSEPPVVLEGLRIERDGVTVVRVVKEGEGFRLEGR